MKKIILTVSIIGILLLTFMVRSNKLVNSEKRADFAIVEKNSFDQNTDIVFSYVDDVGSYDLTVGYVLIDPVNDILPARGRAGFPFRKTDDVPLPASSPPMERRGIRGLVNKGIILGGIVNNSNYPDLPNGSFINIVIQEDNIPSPQDSPPVINGPTYRI